MVIFILVVTNFVLGGVVYSTESYPTLYACESAQVLISDAYEQSGRSHKAPISTCRLVYIKNE